MFEIIDGDKLAWHYQAANEMIIANQGNETIWKSIKDLQENDPRFHFGYGMNIRNALRDLGYSDRIFGNIDDHYFKILEIIYTKKGLM